MAKRTIRATTLAFAAAALTAGLGPERARAEGEVVIVDCYRLNPATATIAAGEPVTFRADEDESTLGPMVGFTLVADDGAFRSPKLAPGERWRVTLGRRGVYRYHLEERPSVEGTIVVE